MNYPVLISLLGVCAASMIAERLGAPTTLALNFKGDVKRETRWLAQYGQAMCTVVVALVVWRLDGAPGHHNAVWAIAAASLAASVFSFLVKRLLGRVRPGREQAGQFLGPTLRHANWRESFPSSHSASAVALSAVLATLYPQGTAIFWCLAIGCAVLRYLMDAHWPSDVLAGIALGYAAAHLTMPYFLHP
jgi:membrane-associated phospholipid phosphatase